jgi:N6-adenosine-specific RNA methylase IME4
VTPSLPLDAIRIGERHRRDLGDITGLALSIESVGLLHPIVVKPDGTLIAGGRRLAACRKLGWAEIPVTEVDLDQVVRGELAENADRKDFLPSEIYAIRKALAPIEEAAAKERQRIHGGTAPGIHSAKVSQSDAPTGPQRSVDKIGAVANVSGRQVEKIAKVVEAAEREPEKFGPLVDEMDRTGRVHGVYKKLVTAQKAEAIAAEPQPLPAGPFRVIVADPPWSDDHRASDPSRREVCPYPVMSVEEICAMDIAALAHEDAVLWLWTTNRHLPEAFRVVEAWGFTYKTMLTWAKDRMGLGDWLRGQTEHCLLASRGRPTLVLSNQTTLIHGPRREHSRKPDEFFALVEKLCPGSKVELFCREPRPGWAAWGDEVPS